MAFSGKFFIQDKLTNVAPHHESFKQLWETKWKMPCKMGVYPFMFSAIQDFQPIVNKLIERDFKEPYDWDKYAQVFFPKAEELVGIAEQAEKEGNKAKASEYYKRASSVYRISRFPAPRSEKQRYAWGEGKKAFIKGLILQEHPVKEIQVPHTHGLQSEGKHIPIYIQLPAGATKSNPAPVVLIMTGLDGYRTELAVWMEGWRLNNIGTIVVEIPGTGDSPALATDPKSPDRQWSSLLDWMDAQDAIDSSRVCVWAYSTGGFYAIRLAYTHPKRVAGVVALGGCTHHVFDPEWLEASNRLEYPFDLGRTLAYKFGYGDDFERFKVEASDRFSLLKDGTLDGKECARLLLVNGVDDEIFPIDDYWLAVQHGPIKEMRLMPETKHMGEPMSFTIIIPWIYDLLGVKGDLVAQLKTIPFKAQY